MKFIFLSGLLSQINGWGFISSKIRKEVDHGYGHVLNRDAKIILGQFVMSENSRFKAEIDDGNFVLLDDGHECWSTNIFHHGLGWEVETEMKF
tara:strand:- start:347 stop:625 length:279 start_codon:yes stop_codon:yes gene_type:complete